MISTSVFQIFSIFFFIFKTVNLALQNALFRIFEFALNLLFMSLFNGRLWAPLLHIWAYWAGAKVLAFPSICMQSTLRSWISQCAFVTRTWFWHRWISLVERYRYLVLDDNLLLWISRISASPKSHLWAPCTKVKTLVSPYKFCISALIYERILNRANSSTKTTTVCVQLIEIFDFYCLFDYFDLCWSKIYNVRDKHAFSNLSSSSSRVSKSRWTFTFDRFTIATIETQRRASESSESTQEKKSSTKTQQKKETNNKKQENQDWWSHCR